MLSLILHVLQSKYGGAHSHQFTVYYRGQSRLKKAKCCSPALKRINRFIVQIAGHVSLLRFHYNYDLMPARGRSEGGAVSARQHMINGLEVFPIKIHQMTKMNTLQWGNQLINSECYFTEFWRFESGEKAEGSWPCAATWNNPKLIPHAASVSKAGKLMQYSLKQDYLGFSLGLVCFTKAPESSTFSLTKWLIFL